MSLQAPTTKETSDLAIAQFEASLGRTIPILPKSFLRILAKVLAGIFMLLYKYAGFMFLQMFVRTATYDQTTVNGRVIRPLREWGRLIGEPDLREAVQAQLTIDITVSDQGGTLPAGSQLVSSTNGVTYITVSAVSLDSATVEATVKAVSDQAGGRGAGDIGNLDVGATMSFASPLGGVRRSTVVTNQTVQGVDAEAVSSYRSRIIKRFQRRPQGGALADYEQWGLESAGILNIYPYTGENAGEVDVYVEATAESSGSAAGIPTEAQLEEVYDLIQFDENGLASRRPANAGVNVYPIERTGFNVTINGLEVDNQAEVRQLIEAALGEYYFEREPFISGLSRPPRADRISLTAVTGVIDTIVSNVGGVFTSVSMDVEGGATGISLYELGIGEKSALNNVSYL